MKRILKKLNIVQEKPNEKKVGRGFSKAYRLNPYNPLSYATIVITIILGIICFGFIGFWKEVNLSNPFKWD